MKTTKPQIERMLRFTETEQRYIAQRVARWLYDRLITTTQIERAQALRAAQEAGNAAAQTLRRSLEEIE